jgi:hypothetical protein
MLNEKDQATIDELQYKRSMVYDAILSGDFKNLPPDLLRVAMTAMADIEKSIINRIKLTQGERGLDEEAAHNKLLADIIKSHVPAESPPSIRQLAEPPELDIKLIEGELD